MATLATVRNRFRDFGYSEEECAELLPKRSLLQATHGRPTAMLAPVTEEDIEDVMLAYSPSLRKKIQEGLKDVRAGRTMPLSEYVARRKKKHARKA